MKEYPIVSIIFPNYNGGKEPLECLRSIKNLNYPKNKIEVIVIDNASSDGSIDMLEEREFSNRHSGNSERSVEAPRISMTKRDSGQARMTRKITLIKNKENVGFARAINQGIKQSNGEYIFITNDDVVFEASSMQTMIDFVQKNPTTGVLGGKIFLKQKPNKVVSSGYMMNKWTGKIYRSKYENTVHEPDWIQGCAMLVPKAVISKIGMLDENFSLIYFEDFDLCFRAKKAGYSIAYIPSAHFWHGQSKTMDKDFPHKYYQWYKNKIRFIVKNLPLVNTLVVLSIQIFLVTPYRALVLRDGRFIPFLKGLFWNIRNIRQTLAVRITI